MWRQPKGFSSCELLIDDGGVISGGQETVIFCSLVAVERKRSKRSKGVSWKKVIRPTEKTSEIKKKEIFFYLYFLSFLPYFQFW